MDGILGSGAEWQGATSKWHIQSKDRRDVGPQGPAHWPRRPFDVGGFCDSVHNAQPRGQRHFVDLPTSVLPSTTREQQWRSSSRRVEAFCEEFDRPTGTKRIVPNNLEGNEGWTGKLNNYTGPRHFNVKNTSVNPTDGNSYFVEKKMGTKKAVFSSSMGLPQHYEENERRCQRPAEEWSLDTKMQRKIRLPNHEDRRNGTPLTLKPNPTTLKPKI
ncbi:hypothetical protein T484DRAFT_2838839 [Baffinella frigidus]|nr:hypothetical protein T484DRAFT_2838839 [Cryptophyta sp. CCMP2293]